MKYSLLMITFLLISMNIFPDDLVIEKWLSSEFSNSTLTREEQRRELEWFRKAAEPFRGMEIKVVSERIKTHFYESEILAKAFMEITGIKVVHEINGEDDVVKKLVVQKDKGIYLYDMFICDSDLLGTLYRSEDVVPVSDFMKGEGRSVTLPTLDIDDFIGIKFTTAPDGKIYQLPDQQFVNLYWYRADWFENESLKERFKKLYGYNLGVPVNWSAYEDIAEFFTKHVRYIDGKRVYGHMDYGKNDPSLGWRFSDAWFSMAGVGDVGLPNGLPVDDWGIRVEDNIPVGASVSRGGAVNSPAAVYALKKYHYWLENFAPPEASEMNFTEAGSIPGTGVIAQQIFWYSAFTADLLEPGLSVLNNDGTPKWKMAPSPHGAYWKEGMKMGYQDVGAWTMLKSTPLNKRKAAWLYAQFTVSRTVSLKKMLVGLTPVRKSDIESQIIQEMAPELGGLIEFYNSPAREIWTPTGTNIPDYPGMSTYWYTNIAKSIHNNQSYKISLDNLAADLDKHLDQLSDNEDIIDKPKLNKQSASIYWLNRSGAPKPELTNEDPPGVTIDYEEAIKKYD